MAFRAPSSERRGRAQVWAQRPGAGLGHAPSDLALGIVEVPNSSALRPVAAHASTQAGSRSRSIRWTHSVHDFHAALAARHVRLLVDDRLVHERARLVRARHHAVAAADAAVPVHQHDAVGALERRTGGADVDAGRVGAVLAHHRRGPASLPPRRSLSSTLRIHCAAVAILAPESPFSRSQATTQASQSVAQRLTSTRRPQRTRFDAPSAAGRPCARSISVTPGASVTPPAPPPRRGPVVGPGRSRSSASPRRHPAPRPHPTGGKRRHRGSAVAAHRDDPVPAGRPAAAMAGARSEWHSKQSSLTAAYR